MIDVCLLTTSLFGTRIALQRVEEVPVGDLPHSFCPVGGWRTGSEVRITEASNGRRCVEWEGGHVYAD